jgi:hypothetical protein
MSVPPAARQLHTFCVTFAVFFILLAPLVGALPFLISPDETIPPLLLMQYELCAVVLVFLAAWLVYVRVAFSSPRIAQVARQARMAALVSLLVVVAGGVAVLLVPFTGDPTGGRFPPVAVSVLTIMLAFFAYNGLSRAPRARRS